MTNLEYVSSQYQERLMSERFIKSLGAEATDATFIQDALLEVEG